MPLCSNAEVWSGAEDGHRHVQPVAPAAESEDHFSGLRNLFLLVRPRVQAGSTVVLQRRLQAHAFVFVLQAGAPVVTPRTLAK